MLSLSTIAISGDLPQKLKAISQAGFSKIEISESDLMNYDGSLSEIGKMISDQGLALSGFQKFADLEGLEGKDRIQAFDRLEKKFDLLNAVGSDLLLLVSSQHPKSSADEQKIIADLTEAAERGNKRGLRIAYLALPWAKNVKVEWDATKIVTEVNQKNLGLALNSLFFLGEGAKASQLRNIPIEKVFYIQLADAPLIKMDFRHLSKNFLLPGQGELNLKGFVSLLARSGYQGDWTVSYVSDTLIYSNHTAVDCYRAIANLLDAVKKSEPQVDFPIPNFPKRIPISGFEFIEFSAIESEHDILSRLLKSMGFRQERKHRSQEITLWRQGAVNIIINSDPQKSENKPFLKHGSCVSSLGLKVEDAEQTVERATGLGAEIFTETPIAGEVSLPAIRGAGDHLVHFIDEKSNLHQLWDINFTSPQRAGHAVPTGIRRIDHVAQTMEYDQMMNWVLYYLSTFEMTKSSVVDVADPSGFIRSQVLSSPEGEVRLNLNSSPTQNTLAGSFLSEKLGSGVQHIAFLTDNIFETSQHLKSLDFPRLTFPEGYYADLQSKFNLDDETLVKLREGNILYDKDGQGEYFQIYSVPHFHGFFFEIVERRLGYQGYGARNASFRLQAQMRLLQGTKS